MVAFARDLASYGDRIALVTLDGEVSYADLAQQVDAVAGRLGAGRRLVLVPGANTVDALVGYLAALAAGHPVLLVPGDRADVIDSMIARYDPDVVLRAGVDVAERRAGVDVEERRAGVDVEERRAGSAHELHPDLALLLSTSGSTGSAKLVRLSAENLRANAESIASYLGIGSGDRAATTLPMHYCYGLSVVNSHLLRGASLLLTDRSVADAEFWDRFRHARATSFAGVPYTFDLLDRVGFDRMRLPHLRYVTQAGGRLAPDRVRHYAELGRRDGWGLYVMYGQTEATARIAYLPPDLAVDHPEAIGGPIPGGSLRLEPLPDWPDPDTGELVYSGPNVMLGYAESRADLGLGRTVDELHTGDVARHTPEGLFEIVGRRSRFAKIFGLRIDLHRVEASLDRHGIAAGCLDTDDRLTVVLAGDEDTGRARRIAARACRLPARAVRVHAVGALPRLANGKLDYPALRALVRDLDRAGTGAPGSTADLVALFAELLDRPDANPDSTFASLGGDSLSYVEISVRLEQALGHLPADWHTTPIRDLQPARRAPRRTRPAALDTGVALRAVSIVLIVSTHATLFGLPGGAHLLLGVAGFNFARFHLTPAGRWERLLGVGRSVRRIALASICWIALAAVFLADNYGPAKVFLMHNILGPPGEFNDFWFIEAIVYMLLAAGALLAIGRMDRAERRFPFALPMTLVALALVTRYQLIPGVRLATPLAACWLFALGWAAAKATTNRQRLLVTLAAVATVPGFHDHLAREAVIAAGLVLLIWVPTIPSLPLVNRIAGVLAAASLSIYLTHWQVYSRLEDTLPVLAVAACLSVGIAYKVATSRASAGLAQLLRRVRRRMSAVAHDAPVDARGQALPSTRASVSRAAG